MNWWYVIAGAGVASVAVGAAIMRKRVRILQNASMNVLISNDESSNDEMLLFLLQAKTAAAAKSLNGDEAGASSDFALMGGVTAAFGGIMARMGLKSSQGSSGSSTASEETGVVSKRMNLLRSGGDVEPLDGGGAAPAFIEIPHEMGTADPLPVEEGVEIEGPYRPSSQYAI